VEPYVHQTQPVHPKRQDPAVVTFARPAIVAVAVAAFVAGLVIGVSSGGPGRPSQSPPRSASLTATGTASSEPSESPLPHATLALGLYHLTPVQALVVNEAVQFFAAYNAGQLDAVMSLLSAQPQLVDCNYVTQSIITLDGRAAVAAYLRMQFADHDRWMVQFFNENPDDGNGVGVVPIERSNDTLKRLGLGDGTKRDFPVVLVLALGADEGHFSYVEFAGTQAMCTA
jgi:hypothetical protein